MRFAVAIGEGRGNHGGIPKALLCGVVLALLVTVGLGLAYNWFFDGVVLSLSNDGRSDINVRVVGPVEGIDELSLQVAPGRTESVRFKMDAEGGVWVYLTSEEWRHSVDGYFTPGDPRSWEIEVNADGEVHDSIVDRGFSKFY